MAAAAAISPAPARAAEPAPLAFTVDDMGVSPAGKYRTMSLKWQGASPSGSPASLPWLVVEAEDGTSGTVSVTFTAGRVAPLVATPKITVVDDVDLVAGPAQPGDGGGLPLTGANNRGGGRGRRAAHCLDLVVFVLARRRRRFTA